MSAPHDETHEMHSEVATVARAMLSAGLAVADARRQRQLRAARDAERALPQAPRTEPAADRVGTTDTERAPHPTSAEHQHEQEQEQQTVRSRPGGTVPTPAGFSRRDIQQHADTMAATPGSGAHDARLRDVVSAAVPAAAEAVLADPAWPALRASLRHIENNGGDPGTELAAAADRRPLRGVDSAARVLRWRLATASAEQGRANGAVAVPADTRDRDAGSVLRALAADPVGTAAAYADAEAHRDTNPVTAQAWDEALRAENIDPQRVRDDATAAHRDTVSVGEPRGERDLEQVDDPSRDDFAEDYLSALDRAGIDPDTARTQLSEGDSAAEPPAAEQAPAPPRTMYSDGAEAARLAGLSHPRSVAEQLATRTPGGQETPAARGQEQDPIRHRDRSR
jgi:hypothetical protein